VHRIERAVRCKHVWAKDSPLANVVANRHGAN
jgi:hypothetical protein